MIRYATAALLTLCCLGLSTHGAAAQVPCEVKFGPHAHASSKPSTDGKLHCECEAGYEPSGGKCMPKVSMRQGPVTEMRAMTRTECVRFAGNHLQEALNACKAPVFGCMKHEGVQDAAASCTAAGALAVIAGLSAYGDPSKLTTAAAIGSLGAAAADCRSHSREIADKCGPTWGTCQNAPLKAWKAEIAGCPAK